MGFIDRLTHAWNVFKYGDGYKYDHDIGVSSGWRQDKVTLTLTNERSIIAAIYNRIAVDAASINIRHVRADVNGRYLETLPSKLNQCLSVMANIDQTGRAFIQDVVLSLIDEGHVAIIPTAGELNREGLYVYEIESLRVGEIITWYPEHVRLRAYNEKTGVKEETILPKSIVAIVENPFYSVMNEPNSTLKRLVRKLNCLDDIDAKTTSGKLDLIIQLPYIIKTPGRRAEADKRIQDIQKQLEGSKLGIAYTDGTERVVQLNRSIENNLLPQIEYLTNQLYSQLGISEAILNGTAGEEEVNLYFERTIGVILTAVVEAMSAKFLTKTARTQGQTITFFRDPFKIATLQQITEMADTFIRNQIFSANDIRAIVGYKPDPNPQSDQLVNPNMPQEGLSGQQLMEVGGMDEMTEEDYQEAFAQLDEVDAELDDLESSLDLEHYASPYYDPVKAHEYYMKNRELIGRRSTAGLNEEGKKAARYVKNELTSERKRKQQRVRDDANAEVSTVKSQAQANLESAREKKKQQIANHKAAMDAQIKSLRASLEGLDKEKKKELTPQVQSAISTMREENKKVREELNAEYAEYSSRVRENRSDEIAGIREESSERRAGLKTRYDEKYIEELDRIKADPTMRRQKKSSSKSTGRKSVLKKT